MEKFYSQQKQDQELTGSDHEVLIAKFRVKLKKLNTISYDYTVEVTDSRD